MSFFALTPVPVLTANPPQSNWLIKGVLEIETIGMIFGPPGTGKSFLLMDIAFCIGAGIGWNGHQTKQGNVAYLAGEGFSGMKSRFKALETKYGVSGGGLYMSNGPVHLSNLIEAQAVYDEINLVCPDPALIVIDTLHRHFGDGDENSARDLGLFLRILTELTRVTGASILLAHHSGHASSDRARGSSALRAAMDVEYKLEKSGSNITVSCTKAKEFDAGPPMHFELEKVELPGWFDDEGNPLSSAVLQPTSYTPTGGKSALTERDLKALQALAACIERDGKPAEQTHVDANPLLLGRQYVPLEMWRQQSYQDSNTGSIKADSIRQAFLRSRERLISEAKVIVIEDFCYSLE